MTTRSKTHVLSFGEPFSLNREDGVHPAGDYKVEVTDDHMEGAAYPSYRRIQTLLHIPPKAGSHEPPRIVSVNPTELAAALMRSRHETAR